MLRYSMLPALLAMLLLTTASVVAAPPSRGVQISIPFIPKSNIVASNLHIEKSGSGAPFMYVTLTNKGLLSTGSFTLHDYLSVDGVVVHPWPHTRQVGSLFPGESRIIMYPLYLEVASSFDTQTWQALVIANYAKTVSETTYADNIVSGTFYK